MSKLLDVADMMKAQDTANKPKFDVLATPMDTSIWCKGITQIVQVVAGGHDAHFMTEGAWSQHELVAGLLDITGPATVFISSYAMSETAVRTLSMLKDAGKIEDLWTVIDNRIETRTAGSLQMLKGISDHLALVACHAKVTVLYGHDRSVLIVGSANYTENKRIEIGIATSNREAACMHTKWITDKCVAHG